MSSEHISFVNFGRKCQSSHFLLCDATVLLRRSLQYGRRWLQFPNNRCSIQSYFWDQWTGVAKHDPTWEQRKCWTMLDWIFDRIQTSSNVAQHHPTLWSNEPKMLHRTMLDGVVGLVWPGLNWGKYDVTCVKEPKNKQKYLAFLSVNYFECLNS